MMSFAIPSLLKPPEPSATPAMSASSASAQANGAKANPAATIKPDSVKRSQPDGANHLADAVKHFASGSKTLETSQTKPANHDVGRPRILHGLNFGRELEAAAKKHGIDPVLLAAVAAQETGGGGMQAHNIDQPNGLGRGPMQIDIGAWPDKASIAHDPAKSTDFAAFLLRDGYNQADRLGDAKNATERTKEALRVYNGSSPHAKTTMTQWPDGRVPYEDSVLRHYEQIVKFLASPASR